MLVRPIRQQEWGEAIKHEVRKHGDSVPHTLEHNELGYIGRLRPEEILENSAEEKASQQ